MKVDIEGLIIDTKVEEIVVEEGLSIFIDNNMIRIGGEFTSSGPIHKDYIDNLIKGLQLSKGYLE